MELLERFIAKVQFDDSGCWLWTAQTSLDGYGKIQMGKRAGYAHRVSYELLVGPIPEGLQLDHLCRVRSCVNPDHLEPVTLAENVRRGKWGQRSHCDEGHELTEDNVYRSPSRPNIRECRKCKSSRDRQTYLRRKAS